jgi:hypothetical protein
MCYNFNIHNCLNIILNKSKYDKSKDPAIKKNPNIKKWMKNYKDEYELESVNYLPVLTFAENVF